MYFNKYIYFDWEAYTDKDGVLRFNQILAIDYFGIIICNIVLTRLKLKAKTLILSRLNIPVFGLCTTKAYKLYSQVDHDYDNVNAFAKKFFNQYRGYTCIAHYGKNYDFIPIIY